MNVKALCSGTLTMGTATCYEIRKTFEKGLFAAFYDAGYSSNYPTLGCLLNEDLATVEEEVQSEKLAKKSLQLDIGRPSALQASVGWPLGSLIARGLGVEFYSLPAKYLLDSRDRFFCDDVADADEETVEAAQ